MKSIWIPIVAFVYFLILVVYLSCGRPKPTQKIVITKPRIIEPDSCEGSPIGNKRQLVCDQEGYLGYIEQECRSGGNWELSKTTCKPPPSQCETESLNKTTFVKDILPIIGTSAETKDGRKNCISCHVSLRLNEYEYAAALAEESYRRINLGDQIQRMPPYPDNKALDFDDREKFKDWITDGLLNDIECQTDENQENLNYNSLDDLERDLNDAIEQSSRRDQLQTRFLTADTKANLGSSQEEMQIYYNAINKTLNALSTIEDDPLLCVPVDRIKGACKIDLEAAGLTPTDWERIVANSSLTFVSVTNQGKLLRDLTGSDNPWLTGDQFIEGSLDDPETYYDIMGIPLQLADYWRLKGVDFAQDIADFRATFGGTNKSPIGIFKNRLIAFFDSDDGMCSITFDPEDVAGVAESNLTKFPLVEVGIAKFFFNASEVLCSLPNGGFEMSLWSAAGLRQNAAPTTIVVDVEGGKINGDFEIKNASDCYRCHSGGFIPFQDEIRASVLDPVNAGQFDRNDVLLVQELYGTQGELDATFIRFNDEFRKTRADIGVDTLQADPINYYSDRYKKNWSLDDICGFIRFPLNVCAQEIQRTSVAGDLGQIFLGQTVSFDVFSNVFDQLVADLLIGQEPLNRQSIGN